MKIKKVFVNLLNKIKNADYLYWSPRVFAAGIILFLGVFALDEYGTGEPLYKQLTGFLIHLAPSFLLTVILVIAWKWEDIGGLVFILAGTYMWLYFDNSFEVNLMLFGPLFITGILFIIDCVVREGGIKRIFVKK